MSAVVRSPLLLRPGGNAGPMPLTGTQRLLTGATVIVDATVVLTGRIEPGLLTRAVHAVCQRHESLRTTIHLADDLQVVHGYTAGAVSLERFSVPPERLLPTVAELARRELDPQTLPVFRCVVVSAGPELHAVHLAVPHAVSDLVSLHVVARDFLEFLRAAMLVQAPSLPPVRAQFADYLRWREELLHDEGTWAEGAAGARALRFWSDKLTGAAAPAFGHVRSGPDRLDRMTFRHGTVDPELTAQLLRVCAEARCSMFHVVLAAFEEAVARQTGTADVTTWCLVHGRGRPQLRETVGPLTEETVFRHLVRAPSRREYLTKLATDVLLTYAHQDIPLTALRPHADAVRRWYGNRRFRSMLLQYRPLPIGADLQPDLPGVEAAFPPGSAAMPAFRLPGIALVSVDRVADRLEVQLMYDARVWPDAAMRELLAGFLDSCRSFAHRPDEPLTTR